MKARLLAISGALLLCMSSSFAQAEPAQCQQLVQYRDGQLFQDMDKAFNRLSAAQNSLQLLDQVRSEIEDARAGQVTLNIAYQLTLTAKTVANSIGGILSLDPATGKAVQAASGASKWVAAIINTSTATGLATAINDNSLVEYMAMEVTGSLHPVGAGVKAVYTFSQDIQDHHNQQQEGKEILQQLDGHLSQLEGQLKRLHSKAQKQQAKIQAINIIKNEIDRACG